MDIEYPSSTEKVLLVYVAAKCNEIQSLKVGIADIVKDFFTISNNIGLCLYDIISEKDSLPSALETDIEYLKLHGLIEVDIHEPCIHLTPLGQYLSMSFSTPEEIQKVVKNNFN